MITHKLDEKEKMEVCKMLASFRPYKEISEEVKKRFGKSLIPEAFSHYNKKKKWGEVIKSFRQEWALGIMEEPIAHKRFRLHELMDIYATQKQNIGKDNGLTDRDRYFLMLSCLKDAKEELDEAKTHVTNMYLTQINELPDEELKHRRDLLLEKLQDLKRREIDASEITSATTIDGDSGAPS